MKNKLCVSYTHDRLNYLSGPPYSLQRTQRHRGTNATRPVKEPKARIKRFSEFGVEGVEVDQFVSGDFVEGQSASRIVHIHCYSPRVRGGGGDGCFSVIVTDIITTTGAGHSPGMIIPPKHTGIIFSIPADSFVTH